MDQLLPPAWLTFDADFSFSKARFKDDDPAGDHIPGAIETVIAAGVTIDDLKGGLRVRYFGPRPLIEDNSVRSASTTLLNADIKVGHPGLGGDFIRSRRHRFRCPCMWGYSAP
ncbi:MAG: hypothetical protein ACREV1_04680 [Gammaproteobacteria bacterium]